MLASGSNSLYGTRRWLLSSCFIALTALTTACGGGGDSGAGNSNGSAPPPPPPPSAAPVAPAPPPPAANTAATPMVAGGNTFSLALMRDGSVFAWGDQQNGTLGNGSSAAISTRFPTRALNLAAITRVAAGGAHGMALRSDGQVFVWGANGSGRLGLGQDGGAFATPVVLPGLSGITAIAAGESFSMALRADGTLFTWGDNSQGQLGLGDALARLSPTAVPGTGAVVAIAAGANHALALRSDGSVLAWGKNSDGQLGVGDFNARAVPTPVAALAGRGITQLAAGEFHSLALSADGRVRGWGSSLRGEVGVAANTANGFGNFALPALLPEVTGASAIVAGARHSIALLNDGTLRTWGDNGSGRLGNGRSGSVSQSTFVPQIPQISTVTAIGAGKTHSLAIVADGRVACFGNNFFSQCGRIEIVDLTDPVEVGPGFNVGP